MYISDLIEKQGYSIDYRQDNAHLEPYFGVDTQTREIFLYNVTGLDFACIEALLFEADQQYSKME